jgi:hypothetical protein
MQHYTIFFFTVYALHVSGGFSAYHKELKSFTHSIGYMSNLLAATASVGELEHRCILLVIFKKKYIKDARSHERQK